MDLALNTKKTKVLERNYGILNLIVLTLCVAILIFYITQVNRFVAQQYRINILKTKLSDVLKEEQKLKAEKFQSDGIPQIVQFARLNGMVEANNSLFIFEESSFARR